MSRYKIKYKSHTFDITESAGTVTSASSDLDWAIGLPFGYVVLQYGKKKGWVVEPVIEETAPSYIDFRGIRYYLEWDGNMLERVLIIEDGEEREINWKDLPEQLRKVL